MNNKPDTKASIGYLASVLGVNSFMVPQGGVKPADELRAESFEAIEEAHEVAALPEDVVTEGELTSPLVFVANKETLDLAGRDLFQRMVAAMKKDVNKVLLIQLDLGQGPHALQVLQAAPRSAVVVYGLEAAERLAVDEEWILARWTEPKTDVPVIATHSLPDILARPELKKVVWQHLQMATQRLSK